MKELCRNSAIIATACRAVAFCVGGSIFGLIAPAPHSHAQAVRSHGQQNGRVLTFSERVAYQYAIEEIYWRHRIWPKENTSPKPSLDAVMSQQQIEKNVADYLRNSQALEDYWQRPITAEQLQAEMDRMAQHTKQPEVLREIFEALGSDPFVIAECLARPTLAERSLTNRYAYDPRFHGELKRQVETELLTHRDVKEMKQTNGLFRETEWIRSDDAETNSSPIGAANTLTVRMTQSEWQENVQKLVSEFGNAKGKDAWTQIRTDVISPVQENEECYYAKAVMQKSRGRLKIATIAWRKELLRSWLAKAETQVRMTMASAGAGYTLPAIASSSGGCTDDTWSPTSLTNAPVPRASHTAVWTGSEMVIWGGQTEIGDFNSGGRYNPGTDSWIATNTTNAPDTRAIHTALWTGSEMIVWGGLSDVGHPLNTGGRYNPGADSWIATSTTKAPAARFGHTAVWSGGEMIVWGGEDSSFNYLNSGGRYNPGTDSWIATSTTNAPAARAYHTAVWSGGSEMIVWGGIGSSYFNSGGRYNPGTDSWIATSITNAPDTRAGHTAVSSGSAMIVWGGFSSSGYLGSGGRYNPSADSWLAISIIDSPTARDAHTAVWTGSEMIVWGGNNNTSGELNTGGRYNPGTDSWLATETTTAPHARYDHTAVWTGSEMIVWGGFFPGSYLNSGGRYCAQPSMPTFQAAFSRKTHGAAGAFDVPLPLTGSPGIECRTTGGTNDYTMVVIFGGNVTVTGNPQAEVTLGTGCVGSGGTCSGNVTVNGNTVTVPLTNVANVQTVNVRINGVNNAADAPATDFTIPMSILIGDTNANGAVNAADVAQTKSRNGHSADATNFRSDINTDGSINAIDTSIVKQNSGTSLPP